MISQIDDPIAVVCAADDRYAMPLAVVIRSAIENLSSDRQIVFFIIDGGIKQKNKNKILQSISTKNSKQCQIEWLQPLDGILTNMKISTHITIAAYFRLLIPSLLPHHFSKAIYLDSDLIVKGDLGQLWDIDIADNYLLAVQGLGISYVSSPHGLANYKELGIPAHYKYFNSGVMVINIEKWRTDSISVKVIEYVQYYKEYMYCHDQEGLNAVLAGKWGELEPRWNQTPGFHKRSWKDSPFSEEDFDNAKCDPYIVHFASSEKPWNSIRSRRFPTNDLFFHYVDMTAWTGWRLNIWRRIQFKLEHELKQLKKQILPLKPQF